MKSQTIRLMDVFAIGPLMLWAGVKLKDEDPFRGWLMVAFGAATVYYNGANFLRVAEHGVLPGGRADGRYTGFDPEQLRAGVKVEMEHTSDPDIAREIATDHLVEDPRYYTKLLRAGL